MEQERRKYIRMYLKHIGKFDKQSIAIKEYTGKKVMEIDTCLKDNIMKKDQKDN